jgi:hypothetical protein
MTLVQNLNNLVTRVAAEFKAIRTLISGSATGNSAELNTASKNLVGAINEVRSTAAAATTIDDLTSDLTTTYSSAKINDSIAVAVSDLISTAPGTLDTLTELAAALGDDPNFATTIAAQIGTKAATIDVFTKVELGLDADVHDWVADFNAALA